VGYEIFEMAMNEFRYFAGELAYRFDDRYRLRLTVMEVDLTERHLGSSWESEAIDGSGVSGYFRGYELHLQRFVWRGFYLSGAAGYFHDLYEEDASGQRVSNHTPTLGVGLGYNWREPFGIPYLYLDLAMPFRFYFNDIEEQQLGDATVRRHLIVNNLWLFIGATVPF